MNNPRRKRRTGWISFLLMGLSVLMLAVTLLLRSHPTSPDRSAARLSESIEKRLAGLDAEMDRMLAAGAYDGKLPADMVLYGYRNDTLLLWRNQFPLYNDNISGADLPVDPSQRMRRSPRLPLRDVTEVPSYVNYGPRWYIVKARKQGTWTVIGGLLIKDLLKEDRGGISPHLYYDGSFTIQPLEYGSGLDIAVGGVPLLSFVPASGAARPMPWTWPFWLAMGLGVVGALLFLRARRSLIRFVLVAVGLTLLAFLFFRLTRDVRDPLMLFSPVTYAGNEPFSSLGMVLISHLYMLLMAVLVYMMRRSLFRWSLRRYPAVRTTLLAVAGLLGMAFVAVHIHTVFTDIIRNSGICLELTRLQALSPLSGLVYLSMMGLALALPLLAQLLRPAGRYFFSCRRFDSLRLWPRLVFVALAALYFVTVAASEGQRKEQQMASTWAGRLAMDRDISLERRLLRVESSFESDKILRGLMPEWEEEGDAQSGIGLLITQRVRDGLLRNVSQNYDIGIFHMADGGSLATMPVGLSTILDEWVGGATPINEGSSFLFSTDGRGRSRYAGVFYYPGSRAEDPGSRLIVCIESKSNKEERGYLSLLNIPTRESVAMPPVYSYGRYRFGELISSKGTGSYPTLLPGHFRAKEEEGERFVDVQKDFVHFVNVITPDEVVVISRPRIPLLSYFFCVFLLALFMALPLWPLRPHSAAYASGLERNYYSTRIQTMLYSSLLALVVVVGGFSTYFVNSRAQKDRHDEMVARIGSIQDYLQNRMRYYPSLEEAPAREMASIIEEGGDALKSDITFYGPDGRMFRSTRPEIYRQMLIGVRMSDAALDAIRDRHERYSIATETLLDRRFQTVYAPVYNASGGLLGYVSTPFTRRGGVFPVESMTYVISIVAIFLILLLVVDAFLRPFLRRMFQPIVEIGRKMRETDISHLECIEYHRDDEISTLVKAYNRMVMELTDSSQRLAQAERDRAWSEMARQVAHEIKNPLTPIKLRLQMLIRMKESGNPAWTEKFDEVSAVVLEHIDILADTANQFSTFAKLYTEDPVEIDLDSLIQEEISLFDGREGVSISYFGLSGAKALGPKPQLTRVLVNLITNAVQAVEEGEKPGEILVSLRHSSWKDGYYDIVVEDNGPGVPPENQAKLFTPNFTTKNRGTGLGLAICRSIVERCGGEIVYSRSFSLGGACFTVHYPK